METENVFAPMEWRGAMTALVTPPNSYWRLRSTPARSPMGFGIMPPQQMPGPTVSSATFVSNVLPIPVLERAPGQHVQPPPGRRFGRIWPWGGVGRGGV